MATEIKTVKLEVLLTGLEPEAAAYLEGELPDSNFFRIANAAEFEKFLEEPGATQFHLIFCGNMDGIAPQELAQTLRMNYLAAGLYFVTFKREGYDRTIFVKNGFTDAFLLPMDSSVVKNAILEMRAKVDKGYKLFRPVNVVDVQPDQKMDFEMAVYLPSNKKYITFNAKGESIEPERVERLQKHKVTNMFVPHDQMKQFYDYSASRLKDLSDPKNTKISETERKERLHTAVRDLITGVFKSSGESSFETGKGVLEDTQKIIDQFIVTAEPNDWYSKLRRAMTQSNDTYSHAASVSSYAALFSIGLNVGRAADLAVAGMFHDLGMAELPAEIQKLKPSEMSADQKKLYDLHPEASIKVTKEKKLVIPPAVMTAILQHHERYDGSGFPKQLAGKRISIEAQILGIADEFDYLTKVEEGKKSTTPQEAIDLMIRSNKFDIELLKKIRTLFPKDA